jgi:hypothetical protein
MKCPKCSTELPDKAKFCPYCGPINAPSITVSKEDKKYCSCDNPINERNPIFQCEDCDTKFCRTCENVFRRNIPRQPGEAVLCKTCYKKAKEKELIKQKDAGKRAEREKIKANDKKKKSEQEEQEHARQAEVPDLIFSEKSRQAYTKLLQIAPYIIKKTFRLTWIEYPLLEKLASNLLGVENGAVVKEPNLEELNILLNGDDTSQGFKQLRRDPTFPIKNLATTFDAFIIYVETLKALKEIEHLGREGLEKERLEKEKQAGKRDEEDMRKADDKKKKKKKK